MTVNVEDAGLPERARKALMRGGYITMDDVLKAKEYELLRLPEFGRKSLNEIHDWAKERGKISGRDRDLKQRQLREAEERLCILERDIATLRKLLEE